MTIRENKTSTEHIAKNFFISSPQEKLQHGRRGSFERAKNENLQSRIRIERCGRPANYRGHQISDAIVCNKFTMRGRAVLPPGLRQDTKLRIRLPLSDWDQLA